MPAIRSTWRSARSAIDIAAAFNRSGIKDVLALRQLLCGLNLSHPTFAFSPREHRPLRYPCVAGEFSQTDAACVSSFNLLPGFVCDRCSMANQTLQQCHRLHESIVAALVMTRFASAMKTLEYAIGTNCRVH